MLSVGAIAARSKPARAISPRRDSRRRARVSGAIIAAPRGRAGPWVADNAGDALPLSRRRPPDRRTAATEPSPAPGTSRVLCTILPVTLRGVDARSGPRFIGAADLAAALPWTEAIAALDAAFAGP